MVSSSIFTCAKTSPGYPWSPSGLKWEKKTLPSLIQLSQMYCGRREYSIDRFYQINTEEEEKISSLVENLYKLSIRWKIFKEYYLWCTAVNLTLMKRERIENKNIVWTLSHPRFPPWRWLALLLIVNWYSSPLIVIFPFPMRLAWRPMVLPW